MKRTIIRIDEAKCDGCGLCVPACHEGAIRVIDGKARLVGDALCDGLGACLGECPRGAIAVEEREAESYDEIRALENIMTEGPAAVAAHLRHLKDHDQREYLEQAEAYLQRKGGTVANESPVQSAACGCPGSMTRDFRDAPRPGRAPAGPGGPVSSELRQWPVQLRLLNPAAPFLKDAELVIAADCVPVAYADFHRRFLKGKALAVFCPKLDEDLEEYTEKLAGIFRTGGVRSVTVVRMEVPCCGGTLAITEEAVRRSGRQVVIKEYTVSLQGELI